MSRSTLFYFSGTGNSLHVARELQKRIPDLTVVPILRQLKGEVVISEECSGIVFPVYMATLPHPVLSFLEKAQFLHTRYFYVITTHAGYPGKIDYQAQKLVERKGIHISAYYPLKMIINSPTGLAPKFMVQKDWANQIQEKNQVECQEDLMHKLDSIAKTVQSRVHYGVNRKKGGLINRLIQSFLMNHIRKSKAQIKYFVDSDCVGCGACERVCLSGKIQLVDKKPVWRRNHICYYCYACFNFCPTQAILVKYYTKKDGRYHYPGVSHSDISNQKELVGNP